MSLERAFNRSYGSYACILFQFVRYQLAASLRFRDFAMMNLRDDEAMRHRTVGETNGRGLGGMSSELHYWSVPVGRLNGIPVRLHLAAILTGILLMGLVQSEAIQTFNELDFVSRWPLVFVSLLTVGAALAALGLQTIFQLQSLVVPAQSIRSICLLPWGAQFQWHPTATPRVRLQVYSTGLIGNVGLLACTLLILAAWGSSNSGSPWSVFQLSLPQLPIPERLGSSWLACFAWLNACLLGCRLLPIAPLDLGLLLESWSDLKFSHIAKSQRTAVLFLCGLIASILIMVCTYFLQPPQGSLSLVRDIGPLFICVGLVFAARRHYLIRLRAYAEEQVLVATNQRLRDMVPERRTQQVPPLVDENEFATWDDTDLNQDWTDDSTADSEIDDWMDEQRASREQARQNQVADEEAMLDAILLKVSDSGIQSLSDQEREVLNRLSQLYRRRRELRL